MTYASRVYDNHCFLVQNLMLTQKLSSVDTQIPCRHRIQNPAQAWHKGPDAWARLWKKEHGLDTEAWLKIPHLFIFLFLFFFNFIFFLGGGGSRSGVDFRFPANSVWRMNFKLIDLENRKEFGISTVQSSKFDDLRI